jgi:Na+/melibiose symporter-like transporter
MADKFPLVYAIGAVSQMVSIPLWTRLAERYERSRIWALGIAAFGLLLPLQLLLPYGARSFSLMVGLVVLESFANAASQVPQMAVIADCIDYGLLRTGANLAGSYNALQQFILKASLAAGGAAGFMILSLARYDAKSAHHSASSLQALGLVHTLLPLGLFGLSGLLLWSFPLNRRRQMIIRRRIESRALASKPA